MSTASIDFNEIVRCYAQMAPSPEAVSNGLAFLQVDLSEPDFHRHALAQARTTLAALKQILDDGVRSGRLAPWDTKRLALALHSTIGGAMVAWAVLRQGTAESMMLDVVETLLAPHVMPPRRGRQTAQAPVLEEHGASTRRPTPTREDREVDEDHDGILSGCLRGRRDRRDRGGRDRCRGQHNG
jgi:hypothetical protein